SSDDYEAVGIPFEKRWQRFDEAIQALRALWRRDGEPFIGRFYSTEGMSLTPRPAQPYGPPIWIGSWGSDAGLRRVARLADGWLASGYNATPEAFGETLDRLRQHLRAAGRDEGLFTNTVATLFLHVTEHAAAGDAILADVL